MHDESRCTYPAVKGETLDQDDATHAWESALATVASKLKEASSVALLLSPNLSCEDAWLLCDLVRSADEKAIIGLGPVPVVGEDKTFKSGFVVRSEKAPNARGVETAAGHILDVDTWKKEVANADVVIVTGNYPAIWDTPTLNGNQYLVLIDTLSNELTERADAFLPAATWAEKAGTFENINNVLQTFEQALIPIGHSHSEAQIAIDLHALVNDTLSTTFNAATVRRRMADSGIGKMLDVKQSQSVNRIESDMPLSEV